jgi:hypothetical protein
MNNKEIMGQHAAGKKTNIAIACVFIFSLVTTYFAIIDFIAQAKEVFG